MKNQKTILYGIAILLISLVIGEWYALTNYQEMPNWVLSKYLKVGFWLRLITFASFPLLLYSKEDSLIERYNKKGKTKPISFDQNQRQWVIFAYISVAFFALIAINYLTISIYFPLFFYTILGFLAILFSFFSEETSKILTDRKIIFTLYSINIQGENGLWLNIVNVFRGILTLAANGAGKSVSVVEPCIEQYAFKGFAGILFDFKFPTLSNISHLHFAREKVLVFKDGKYQQVANPTKMYVVSFTDIARSHRINPLNPAFIKNKIYAQEFAEAIINSLQKGQNSNDKFFTPSAITLLTAIIWFLKKHYPQYCTLPHVINLIVGVSHEVLINRLKDDNECADMIRSIITAMEAKAGNQLAGVIASLQMPFGTMNIPEYMYVLSGEDTTLDVNEKDNPKVICIGTSSDVAKALSPIVSLIFTVALKTMNQEDKHHSFCLIDEAAQLYIPDIANIPATCRSNNVSFGLIAQDALQFEGIYGKPMAEATIANLNYQVYLKTANLETAKRVSATIGKQLDVKRSESQSANTGVKGGSSNEGYNYSENQSDVILPNELMQLKIGEAVGICEETQYPTFRIKTKRNIFRTPIGNKFRIKESLVLTNNNGKYVYDKEKKINLFYTSKRVIEPFNQNIDVNIIAEKIKYECKKILVNPLPTVK